MVTICTTGLTFNNSTFCPHSVFMCFMWISEQTAIISLYNINWLVCITETVCVYCAVRAESLYIILYIRPSKAQWSLYVPHSSHYMYHTVVTVPHSGHCMYRTVVTICTASLTFNNSTLCPRSVFMCFVWIWEHRAHHKNLLDMVTWCPRFVHP